MVFQKGFAHILGLIILLAGLVAAVYLVQTKTNFLPKAAENKTQNPIIKNLTQELLSQKDNYEKTGKTGKASEKEQVLDSLISIAIRRKEALLKEIEVDPQAFLDNATLADQKASFPKEVQEFLEDKIDISGELTVVHGDDFQNKKSTVDYLLQINKKDKERYKLYFIKDSPGFVSGSQVRAKGVNLDRQVVLETGKASVNKPGLQIITTPVYPPAVGEQKTAVLLVNFSDKPDEKPYTLDQMKDLMFNADKSVNNYYKENSFNKTYFTGDIFGWYTINSPNCDVLDYPLLAENSAETAGVSLKNEDGSYKYSKIVYVLAESQKCPAPYSGMAIMGDNPGRSWIFRHDFYVYTHEIGHNLGAHHANKIYCNVGDYSNCSEVEYGDRFDVMGITTPESFHFNGPHKLAMGWLTDSNWQDVASDGIFSINALENQSSALQVVKISKADTNQKYYLSFRKKIGFDSNLPEGIAEGVNLHIWNSGLDIKEEPFRTKLIDASDMGLSFESLTDGKIFYDRINKIWIKQVSHTVDSVSVEIKFNVVLPQPNFVIGSWQTLSSMPQRTDWGFIAQHSVMDHALISQNGYLFNVGGFSYFHNRSDNTVYSTGVDDKGVDNGWNELASTPLPRKLSGLAAVSAKGYLLVIGGYDDTSYPSSAGMNSKIYSAKINDNSGTLEAWTMLETSLPEPRFEHAVVVANDYLFVLGGYQDLYSAPQSAVYSAKINNDGTLGTWTELSNTPLPRGLATHAASVTNGYLFVLGGVISSDLVAQRTVYSAKINNDGTLGTWTELSNTPLPKSLRNLSALGYQNHLFIFGGFNSQDNLFNNRTYYARVNNDGTLENWVTDNSLPKGLSGLSVATANDFIFITGGKYNQYWMISNGYSAKISLPSPTPTPFVCTVCSADVNKDSKVNIGDFSYLSGCFGKSSTDSMSNGKPCLPADINGDGNINITDFSCLKSQYGKKCTAP